MNIAIICPATGDCMEPVANWLTHAHRVWSVQVYNSMEGEEAGFLSKCQKGYLESSADILCYFHSDLTIHEDGWDCRILNEFRDPSVGIVGFGGSPTLGNPDIYKIPYHFDQLARGRFYSNLTDAEAHGERYTEAMDVAVVDSMAVCVRRSLLDRLGGWPVKSLPNTSHCSDLWISLAGRRMGSRSRMVGVSATHSSGGKGDSGTQWLNERGGDESLHRKAHEVIYREFRDQLPVRGPHAA